MVSVKKLKACGKKKCSKLLNTKKLMELEGKLIPIKKKCFAKNRSHSLLSVDKCLSKSKDYLEMKKVIKTGRESIKNCIIKKCIKKTRVVRKPRLVKKRKSRKVQK